MDTDRIIAAGLAGDVGGPHPLAVWVHTRDTAHMLAWALNGTVPPSLAGRLPGPRRGPVAVAPQLAPAERTLFFDRLWATTEHAATQGEPGVLLHRQALYLASYDHGPDAAAWTAQTLHRRRDVLARRGWSPHWPEARSTATALARLGDPQPLLDFIDRALADADNDTAEAANLNYWALWLGALPVPQPDDAFMRDRALTGWDPVTLLRGLTRGLHVAPGYVDLYAHSLWALLTAFPWLPQAAGQLAGPLRERTAQLLDSAAISARSRRELTHVHRFRSQPLTMEDRMADDTTRSTASFISEMGVLKRVARTGWWFTGNKAPESVAEHSFRVGVIGSVLAMMEGADPARVALMCLFHDSQETRVGDIPHIGRKYIRAAPNGEVTADQVANAHPAVREGVQGAVDEYETGETPEAIVAHDADKLECLVSSTGNRATALPRTGSTPASRR